MLHKVYNFIQNINMAFDLFNKRALNDLRQQMQQLTNRNITDLSANMVNNTLAIYPKYDETTAGDKYCSMDDIYSIIRRLVNASISVPIYPFYEKNKRAAKDLKNLSLESESFNRKYLEMKALEDLPENNPAYTLLINPSNTYTSIEFWEIAYSLLYIFGRCHLRKIRPEFGVNKGKPIGFEPLITAFVIPKYTVSYPRTIVAYDYIIDGHKIYENMLPEDLVTVKYFNPNTLIDSLSPMEVIKKRITRLEANMNNSVSQMQNGGVPGIIYDKDDADSVISGLRKEAYYNHSSNPSNKGAAYFAAGELGYIQLGLSLVDLDSSALANIDFKKLCNVWGVSDRLFNNDATGSEISDKNARRSLYTDAALPNVFRFAAAIEKSINEDFKGNKIILQPDISGIPELQQDSKSLAEWLAIAWWVTPNEKRELMKFDKLAEPMFEAPLVPTGLITLSDLAGSGDLPLTQDYNLP